MTENQIFPVNDAVREKFIGRDEALYLFYQRAAYRHAKNGVYYYGAGGSGKTWLLHRIALEIEEDPTREVTEIIDFFNTRNHSVLGLQTNIRQRLENSKKPQAFAPYDNALARLDQEKSRGEVAHPSAIAGLELRTNQAFIDCCNEATRGREVVLLFDTFERAQQRHVGEWFLHSFLPKVRHNLIVAISGRPIPNPAWMPDNIESFELSGLERKDTRGYVRLRWSKASEEMIDVIWQRTKGVPLIIDLILDLPQPQRSQFINQLGELEPDQLIQNTKALQQELVGQFAYPVNRRNRIIWTMAYLWRRFDLPMLEYAVENLDWFEPGDYDVIISELSGMPYVKDYPRLQSHLLHDEIQRMIRAFVLEEVNAPWSEMQGPLYDLIVNHYYPEQAIPQADRDLKRQLEAERLGYTLDNDPQAGFAYYKFQRDRTETMHDHDFEELLWGEVREHLSQFEDSGYAICKERGAWLHKHSLFSSGEEHFQQMVIRYKQEPIETRQALGFMYLRQGKLDQAEEVFLKSLDLIPAEDYDDLAMVENNLGQTARALGKWEKALEHYARSFRAAALAHNKSRMVSAYINRGYLYSLQGLYDEAKQQCRKALEQLASLDDTSENSQRKIYALMNLGTAYRHAGEYPEGGKYYERSLQLAKEIKNHEAEIDALQHLGINEHLMGRNLRRTKQDLTQACQKQLHAWCYLTQALERAGESNWRRAIADGLNRLAKVYREIYRLQNAIKGSVETDDVQLAFQELTKNASTFEMPFEIEFQHELLIPCEFSEFNWLGKASRMFEVSDLIANEVNDFHRALESLVEVARTLEEQGYEDKVPAVIRRIERIKGYDYQADLFAAMSRIIMSDLDYKKGNYEGALARYKVAFVELGRHVGYATYILTDRLRDLEWRLREMPPNMALNWCDALQDAWLGGSLATTQPAMLDLLERVQLEVLEATG